MTDIRHGQGENALLFQERVAVVEEADQIRCMFDYMRGDDPVVELGRSDDFRIRPTIPDEVNFLDLIHLDGMSLQLLD